MNKSDQGEDKKADPCKHPPSKYFVWWAFDYKTGKNDILCIGCTVCGEILQGAAEEELPPQPWRPKV